MLCYNYKKVFQFRKFCFFIRESMRNFFILHLRLKSLLSTNKNVKRNIRNFLFSGFASSLLKCKKFLKLREHFLFFKKKIQFPEIKEFFFGADVFYFFELGLKSCPRSSIYYYF